MLTVCRNVEPAEEVVEDEADAEEAVEVVDDTRDPAVLIGAGIGPRVGEELALSAGVLARDKPSRMDVAICAKEIERSDDGCCGGGSCCDDAGC